MTFEEHLKSYLNEKEISSLLSSLSFEDKHAVLLNTRKMNDEQFLSLFPNVIKHPIVEHAYIYDKSIYNLGKTIEHELGCFYLQEPAAMTVSYLLNPQEGEMILDLCAAPGGKTIQSSFLMNNKGLIVSNDISRSRCSAIVENIERLGIANVVVTNNDFSKIYDNYQNYFDKIILDAPCSGSGMFRKDENVKEDWSYNKVIKFAEIQKELILIVYSMLKPGGKLIYSTCSFSKEEDEDVIEYLLSKTNAEEIGIKGELFFKGKYGVHLFPSIFPGEGHYICLLKKPGEIIFKKKENDNKDRSLSIAKKYSLSNNLNYEKFGDYVFGTPSPYKLPKLNIVRSGVKILEDKNGICRYDIHFARYLTDYANKVELTYEEVKKYLYGETLNLNLISKGFYLITYKNNPISIGKYDGKQLKNSYPSGLRKKF